VNDVARMQRHVESKPKYNWAQMAHQNDIALSILRNMSKAEDGNEGGGRLHYEIIDGYEIDIQRPDHRSCTERNKACKANDCLHQKYPDVANAHNAVFLHYLRSHRSADEIARIIDYEYDFSRVTNVRRDGLVVAFDPRNKV